MSTDQEFKTLWNQQKSVGMPEAEALLKRAARVKQMMRMKLIIQTLVLIIIIAILVIAGLNIGHRRLTTSIGLAMMILGMLSYLIVTNQLLPMLLRGSTAENSQEYVNLLIRIKRKNVFMHRVMIDVYFLMLAAGLWLYLVQFVLQMNTLSAILCYLLPSIGLAIAWSYSKRKEYANTLGPLNDLIKKLEDINGQLADKIQS